MADETVQSIDRGRNCARCGVDTSAWYRPTRTDTPWFGAESRVESFQVRTSFNVGRAAEGKILICPRCCHELIAKALDDLRGETLDRAVQRRFSFEDDDPNLVDY